MDDSDRIEISGDRLAVVIAVWLRDIPEWMWGMDPAYERLKAQRRHDPSQAPNPRKEVAALIAKKLEELNWKVSHPQPKHLGSPPNWKGER